MGSASTAQGNSSRMATAGWSPISRRITRKTSIQSAARRRSSTTRSPFRVCLKCGEPAGWLCIECVIEEDRLGFLYARHRKNHPHDNYGALLKVVNSPNWVCAAMRGWPNRLIESHAYPFRSFHGLWIQSTCHETSAAAARTGAFQSNVAPGRVLPPGTL